MAENEKTNSFEMAKKQVDIAAKYLNFSARELDFLNTELIKEIKNRHNVLQNFDKIKVIAPEINEEELDPYEIILRKEDEDWAGIYIKNNNLNVNPLIGFHAGSQTFKGHINKRWDYRKYIEVAKKLSVDYKAKILLLGTENDVNNDILTQTKDITSIPETKNITQSIALMKHCRLIISNDTAIMHIAAALQVPTVAIFGYTNYNELYPWKNTHVIVRRELECNPCFFNSPRPVNCIFSGNEKFKCIKGIGIDEVYNACKKLLSS